MSRQQAAVAPDDRKARRETALSLFALGFAAYHERATWRRRSAALLEETALLEALHAEMPDDQRLTLNLAGGHWSLAGTLWGRKHLSDAALHYERARLLQEGGAAGTAGRPARAAPARLHVTRTWAPSGRGPETRARWARCGARWSCAARWPRATRATRTRVSTPSTPRRTWRWRWPSSARRPRRCAAPTARSRWRRRSSAAHPQDVRVRVLAAEAYGARSSVEQQTPTAPTPAVRRLRLEARARLAGKAIALYRDLDKEGSLSAPARHTMQQVTGAREECAQALEKMGASDDGRDLALSGAHLVEVRAATQPQPVEPSRTEAAGSRQSRVGIIGRPKRGLPGV